MTSQDKRIIAPRLARELANQHGRSGAPDLAATLPESSDTRPALLLRWVQDANGSLCMRWESQASKEDQHP